MSPSEYAQLYTMGSIELRSVFTIKLWLGFQLLEI